MVAFKSGHTCIKQSVVVNGAAQLLFIQYHDSTKWLDKRRGNLTEPKLIKLSRIEPFPGISSFKVEIIQKQTAKMALWKLIRNIIASNLVSLH